MDRELEEELRTKEFFSCFFLFKKFTVKGKKKKNTKKESKIDYTKEREK